MVMGGSYLLLAMMVLLVDESTLETGLDKAKIFPFKYWVHGSKYIGVVLGPEAVGSDTISWIN